MHQVQAAGIILIRQCDKGVETLLLRHQVGHWSFPKGKCDPGESLRQTALRECQEETGLAVELYPDKQWLMEYDFMDAGQQAHKQVTFFLGYVSCASKVVLSGEHSEFVWVSLDRALVMFKGQGFDDSYDQTVAIVRDIQLILSA